MSSYHLQTALRLGISRRCAGLHSIVARSDRSAVSAESSGNRRLDASDSASSTSRAALMRVCAASTAPAAQREAAVVVAARHAVEELNDGGYGVDVRLSEFGDGKNNEPAVDVVVLRLRGDGFVVDDATKRGERERRVAAALGVG
eukprot:CAMPEP_0184198742 /NCGR_PEP_ID=MMETSP0976-20121227/6672_1 /TAXON_ID=483370 /ORGANISM="non described non described, Strain CCMP2097" /LENGTH=144 /DNA_ID=CAMNT_0026503227 /DNA_START=29 /DNA_END=458 /DNA_ORIENTATION=-